MPDRVEAGTYLMATAIRKNGLQKLKGVGFQFIAPQSTHLNICLMRKILNFLILMEYFLEQRYSHDTKYI